MNRLTDEQMVGIVLALLDPGFDCAHNFELLFGYVAALIAEAVEEARKDIALEITGDAEDDWGGADFACGCPDPNPDNVPAALLETCRRTREAAARIARGEVSP